MKTILKNFFSFFLPAEPSSKYYSSYLYRFLKLGLFLAVIFLLIYRGRLFGIPESIDKWIGFLTLPVTIPCILGIYVLIAELMVGEFKESSSFENKNHRMIQMEDILTLSEQNDIIEFVICFNNKYIKCGSSSDSTPTELFDKRYYIDKREFLDIEDFAAALTPYSVNGCAAVIMVDGVEIDKAGLNIKDRGSV